MTKSVRIIGIIKWEDLEMDTCLLNTALAEENQEDKKVALK